jgi:hypothetical protein
LLLTVVGCGEENSSGFVRPPSVSLNTGALAAGSVSGPAAFLRKRTCAIGAPRISPLTAGRPGQHGAPERPFDASRYKP